MTALTTFEKEEYSKRLTRLKRWKDDTIQAGIDLAYIQHSKCYRENYDTFEEFCEKEFGLTDTHARRMIDFAGLKNTPIGGFIENESQAREILKVPENDRKTVLSEAKKNGAITAKSIKDAAKKIDSPIDLDSTGYKITDTALAVWNRSGEIKELVQYLSKIKSALKKAQEENDVLYVQLNHESIFAHISNAQRSLKAIIPYAVCTSCQGRNSNKCTLCKGTGMISEFAFNSFVPEEIKAIRTKCISQK